MNKKEKMVDVTPRDVLEEHKKYLREKYKNHELLKDLQGTVKEKMSVLLENQLRQIQNEVEAGILPEKGEYPLETIVDCYALLCENSDVDVMELPVAIGKYGPVVAKTANLVGLFDVDNDDFKSLLSEAIKKQFDRYKNHYIWIYVPVILSQGIGDRKIACMTRYAVEEKTEA